MNYQDSIQSLLGAVGEVETAINSNGGNPPTAEQSTFLEFLQGPLAEAIAAAQSDPDL